MLSWNENIKKGIVRKAESNKGLVKSLVKIAEDRIAFVEKRKINEKSSSIIFTNYYDSLREICEAIAILRGYKIYSHEAIGLFLREILKEDEIFIKFNRFRILRNGVNYYGKPIVINETVQGVADMMKIIQKLKTKYIKEAIR